MRSMYKLLKDLFPINRSLTGQGTRLTLNKIKGYIGKLDIKKINSKKKVFDWNVPLEWNVKEASIKYLDGKEIVNFKKNNLHLMGYSVPVNKVLNYKDLVKHLYYLKKKLNTIPYVTSYYSKNWGFCLKYKDFLKIEKNKKFKVKIDSSLKKGVMNYGELLIKGDSKKEIFFSTYICHPSMANNELSGPCLCSALAKWLQKKNLKYSYRFVFTPETIGSIAYIKKNFKNLKKNVLMAFNVTCVGDAGNFSVLPSRDGNTISDKILFKVLKKNRIKYKKYSWLERGSDERQYCWPGVDLPMVSLMRSKYHEYDQYHTSDDNLDLVKYKSLKESFDVYKSVINEIEKSIYPIVNTVCEPNLGSRNLYTKINTPNKKNKVGKNLLNIMNYCNGQNSIDEIKFKVKLKNFDSLFKILEREKLVLK